MQVHEWDDPVVALEYIMHVADISNPARRPPYALRWALLLADEFFLQVRARMGACVRAWVCVCAHGCACARCACCLRVRAHGCACVRAWVRVCVCVCVVGVRFRRAAMAAALLRRIALDVSRYEWHRTRDALSPSQVESRRAPAVGTKLLLRRGT